MKQRASSHEFFNFVQKNSYSRSLFITFRFTSLIRIMPPASLSSCLQNITLHRSHILSSRWLVTKRSHLVLYWLRYLTVKSYHAAPKYRVAVTMLPSTRSFYTVTKAPMAHKTNSKEQLIFKFFHFAIRFKVDTFAVAASYMTSVSALAYSLALTQQLFPIFETNVLYLKYYSVYYPLRDHLFFAYKRKTSKS